LGPGCGGEEEGGGEEDEPADRGGVDEARGVVDAGGGRVLGPWS
jgi:hypothetical protein